MLSKSISLHLKFNGLIPLKGSVKILNRYNGHRGTLEVAQLCNLRSSFLIRSLKAPTLLHWGFIQLKTHQRCCTELWPQPMVLMFLTSPGYFIGPPRWVKFKMYPGCLRVKQKLGTWISCAGSPPASEPLSVVYESYIHWDRDITFKSKID